LDYFLDEASRSILQSFQETTGFISSKKLPSEYVQDHIKITAFPGEDIGWLLDNGASDLLMFASDYPHHEGTDDPISRFEKTMISSSTEQKEKFYTDNFKYLIGSHI